MIMAFIGIVAVILFGWLIIQLIYPTAHFLEQLTLSYLFGLGFFTLALFFTNLVGWRFDLIHSSFLLLCLIGICALLLKVKKENVWASAEQKWQKFSHFSHLQPYEKVMIALIGTVMAITLIVSSYWPVRDWDSLVLYDFRAIVFVRSSFIQPGLKMEYFLGYPFFTSLAHMWVYLLGFPYPGIIHSLFYCSFILLMYRALRKRTVRPWALLWTLFFCFSSGLFDHALMTYTNLAYAVFLISGYYYLFEWLENNNLSELIVSALLIGLSTWARSAEPFWLIPVAVIITVGVFRRKWKEVLLFPAIVLAIRQPWQIFEKKYSLPTILGPEQAKARAIFIKTPLIQKFLIRATPTGIWEVLQYFWQNVIHSNPQIYAIFVLASLILFLKIRKRQASFINVIMFSVLAASLLGVLAGIFYFSVFFPEWREVGGSAERMSLFFNPLILFFTANVTYQLFDRSFSTVPVAKKRITRKGKKRK